MSSWVHKGRQFVLVQLEDGLAAMALPDGSEATTKPHH
jgi:hypothetical protein